MIVNYPEGFEAMLMQNLDKLSRYGVWVETPGVFNDDENLGSDNLFGRIPGLPYTREERIASVRRSMAHYRATGEAITTEELEKRMAAW
jgi:hypothetical protein